MSVKLSKSRHFLFLITLCVVNVIIMHDMVVMPLANTFYELFPESVGGVNFILSGPMIFGFLASLAIPYVSQKIGKKTTLVIVCAVFAVASIFGGAVVSLPYIIAARCICGFCYGSAQVVVLDTVADYLIDENKRASFLGIYNASMAGIGAVMSMVAGNLAVSGWQNAYRTYWVIIPILAMVIFFVPKLASAAQEVQKTQNQEDVLAEKRPMGKKFWILLINVILFNICYTPCSMMSGVYVAENGLGNEALAGLVSSLGTVGSAVCCLGFGFLFSKLKARTSLISFVAMTVGALMLHFLPNKNILLVVATFCGGGYGMYFSYVYAQCPSIVAPQNISKAISYLTAGTAFAGFAGTYVITGLMSVTPVPTVTATCLILGIVLAACTVVEFFNTKKMKTE